MVNSIEDDKELKHYFFNKQQFPLVIEPEDEGQADFAYLSSYLKAKNPLFKNTLLEYGGILFRGFKVDNLDKFAEIISSCSLGQAYKYELCAAKRTYLREGITASLNINIPMHNEKSYAADFPTHVYLNCLQAPQEGGETPLANGRKIWLSLPENLQNKLQSKGILYRRHYYGLGIWYKFLRWICEDTAALSWPSQFETNNPKRVEQITKERQESFKWGFGNGLFTKIALPACRMHPQKKELVWFNYSNMLNPHDNYLSSFFKSKVSNSLFRFILLNKYMHPYLASFGDGEPISKVEATFIKEAVAKNTILFTWKEGDVLILDNYVCLHGKNPHAGNRLVLVGLTNDPNMKANQHA
ncbi:TauD/TfdA family dioxygenase [Legionella waltersii]|uniref:Taurine catabolism dioxygenase TauD, TfdA family n=1 Tax=Legionella waltersii TaxID=66969 RepID=A0A0W1AD93_9GAMM|nr:TauD/TfdA family dioxygenase [Legionella waltersii]KTD79236.1 taurine catabolism dioxygenase TauD, TfdA family [Legionella waltersii]SNV12662.1 pyoverdine biosynthesis regulatory gene SyrP-like protein [Legionella waltersii]